MSEAPVTCGYAGTEATPTPSLDGYFLGAYVVNAIDYASARVEWIVVWQDTDGTWKDNDGNAVLVFHTEPITAAQPGIPEGWIKYVHEQAQRMAAQRRDSLRPSGLAALLAKAKPVAAQAAPISRRGF